MGGVDTLSRVVIPYSIQRKGLKWYRKIAELFIDICMYNSYVIWKKSNSTQRGRGITHLQYRQILIKTILLYHFYQEAPKQPGRGEFDDTVDE